MADLAIADSDDALDVAVGVRIAASELDVQAITGSGPGGQHVNRSATRIALRWNVLRSRSVSDEQRSQIQTSLSTRIDSDGWIRIVSGDFRSQHQNRKAARERLAKLLARALIVPRKRLATRPTKASVERRLNDKQKHSEKKRMRRIED